MASFSGNPFSRRESHNSEALWAYKILAVLSWLLVVAASFYYSFGVPKDGKHHEARTIIGQNNAHSTPFTLNSIIASIYWVGLYFVQIGYLWHLFSSCDAHVQAAASVGSHFVLNNLLHFGFIMLFVRSYFWWAEFLLVINFFNLSAANLRHSTTSRLIHAPAISGPLAWTFVAIYSNGAIAVHAHSLPARIFANVAIWGILVYGLFFLAVHRDYTMGFALSVLSAALGVGQFLTKIIAFQWIFAFTIMAVLFLATLVIAVPAFASKDSGVNGAAAADQERAPLLDAA